MKRIIKEYYPEATKKDIELLFYRMRNVGCGYISAINTIMLEYEKHTAKDFRNRFGFNMKYVEPEIYNEYEQIKADIRKKYPKKEIEIDEPEKTLAYNYLFLDFFLYYAKNYYYYNSMAEVLGNVEEELENSKSGDVALTGSTFIITGMSGVDLSSLEETIEKYLADNGITLHCDSYYEYVPIATTDLQFEEPNVKYFYQLTSESIESILNDGDHMVVCADSFNIYYVDGYNDLHLYTEDVGSHAMTVVGTTSDPSRILVSSWGQQYVIDIDEVDGYQIYHYGKFNKSLKYTSDRNRLIK